MDNKNISKHVFDGTQVEKIYKSDTCEAMTVWLESNHVLPKHITATEALLIVHQGVIVFKIKEEQYTFQTGDTYKIPPNVEHSFDAVSNSIFLIVR